MSDASRETGSTVAPTWLASRSVASQSRPGTSSRKSAGSSFRADHDDRLDVRVGALDRLVALLLVVQELAPPVVAVHRDQEATLRVVDPRRQRVRGKAPEDDRVGRADPRAGEHRDRELGHHREVDRDDVVLPHAEPPQHRRPLVHLPVEAAVGDRPLVPDLADPVVRRLVAPRLEVPVDAVVGGVEPPADEPAVEGRLRGVQHPIPLPVPIEELGILRVRVGEVPRRSARRPRDRSCSPGRRTTPAAGRADPP